MRAAAAGVPGLDRLSGIPRLVGASIPWRWRVWRFKRVLGWSPFERICQRRWKVGRTVALSSSVALSIGEAVVAVNSRVFGSPSDTLF